MTGFVAFAAALTLGVLALFAWVVRRSVHPGAAQNGDSEAGLVNAELELLRAQRRELDHEVEIDSVDARHGDEALRELSERADALLRRRQDLAGAAGVAGVKSSKPSKSAKSSKPSISAAQQSEPARVSWTIHALMGLAVVVLATAFYARLGTPDAIGSRAAQAPQPDAAGPSIDELIARLEQKLAEQPDQAEGWLLLAHTKAKLGDFPAAAAAYRKAISIAENHAGDRADLTKLLPDLYADLADALVVQQNGDFAGEPAALIDRALKIDPARAKALALAASAATHAGENDKALGYWRRLQKALPADSPYRPAVEAQIAELGGAAEKTANAAAAASRAPSGSTAANAGPSIAGAVEISPELTAQVRPGDTLFVFARRPAAAAAAAGSRMPLAVARFPLGNTGAGAGEWPKSFELTDANAMAPGAKLSDADEVELVARISRNGSAIAASGDLSSAPLALRPADSARSRGVKLVVDRVLP